MPRDHREAVRVKNYFFLFLVRTPPLQNLQKTFVFLGFRDHDRPNHMFSYGLGSRAGVMGPNGLMEPPGLMGSPQASCDPMGLVGSIGLRTERGNDLFLHGNHTSLGI